MKSKKKRTVLEISGEDRFKFLQAIITNDINLLEKGPIYSALLTPQGKYFTDFFLIPYEGRILLDILEDACEELKNKLLLYRLRAKVEIIKTDLKVSLGLSNKPKEAFSDPRHPALGWRSYGPEDIAQEVDWTQVRVSYCIPETNIELVRDQTYILEAGFERLNGVDFKKGCYIGQEITARMHHKTDLKKGLITVQIDGEAEVGTEILANGQNAGTLYSQSKGRGIAFLRLNKILPEMSAGNATIYTEERQILF